MKPQSFAALILSAGLAAAQDAGPAAGAHLPRPLSMDGWATWSAEARGSAVLRGDGFLVVDYDSPERQPVLLRPALPLELPGDLVRLEIWFACARGDVNVWFLVTDAAGQERRVSTYATKLQGPEIDHDPRRRVEWPLWTQAESRALRFPDEAEIERRVLPEFREAVRAAVWPGPWRLTGLALAPATHRERRWGGGFTRAQYGDMDAGRGTVWLTGLRCHSHTSLEARTYSALSERLRWSRDEPMALFLDDLTTAGGPLDYAVEVRAGYQGPLVWCARGRDVLDRQDPAALFAARIPLPLLPAGDYWLRSWTWGEGGVLGQERLFRWFVIAGGEASVSAPRLGVPSTFAWRTNRPDHVFPAGTREAVLALSVAGEAWRRAPTGATCRVQVVDWRGRPVPVWCRAMNSSAGGSAAALPANGRPSEKRQDSTPGIDLPRAEEYGLACPVNPGNDYFAQAELRAGESVHGRAYLHFGVANGAEETPAANAVPATVPGRDEFLTGRAYLQAEYRHNDIVSRRYPWLQDFDPGDFELFLRQARQAGCRTVTVGACLGDIAILPGVFRWQHLDDQIALAGRHGFRVVLNYIMGTADGRTCPLWIPATPFLDQFGKVFPEAPGPSHWNAAWDEQRLDYYRRLARRCLGNPHVLGYQVKNYSLAEANLAEFSTADYSEPARDAFRDWQRAQGREPVSLPAPFHLPLRNPYATDFGPDLSPEWVRFLDFNVHAGQRFSTRLIDAIREVDPRRQIQLDRKHICYAVEAFIPALRQGCALKNEGSPGFRDILLHSMAGQAGVPFLEELHRQIPTSPSIADATYFYNSYLSDSIFWLFRWKPEQLLDKRHPMFRTLEDMLGYLERVHPHWEEYIRAREPAPEVLVFGSRADQALGPPHRGQFTSVAGIDVLESLFVAHHLPAHFANEYAEWVDPARFRVLFARGEVMRERALERILAYALNGGKLVLVGSAGRYCPERPEARDLLAGPLEGLANVRRLPEPAPRPGPDGAAWPKVKAFPRAELDGILAWAGVRRRITADCPSEPGFQCLLRESADGRQAYAAVMRTWNGTFYSGEIEFQEELAAKYGQTTGTVTVRGLPAGRWRVAKFHRDGRDLGFREAADGQVTVELDPAFAGEVQLFRLTREGR
ncbi:MAG: hypothetical protein JXR77_08050 [Lentisphaeria bacterium]|nr:hypothetical protein [Lentisphaeria bacterium]